MLPTASNLAALTAPEAFWWATGIEDTFITAPHPRTGRTLDEYELTDHYRRWRSDIDLMAELGLRAARYGVPWHRIQPTRGRWDWRHADEPLERMLDLGISPQVDLVHYGLPGWIEGAYFHPDYPALVADFAGRLAERFKGRIHWYTPLNEPRITAWYCGRLGWWPPHARSWRGFVAVMLAVAAGIQATIRRLREVDPDIVAYQVDATDLYETEDPALHAEAERRQDIVYLALDLVAGRVREGHPLCDWLMAQGATGGAAGSLGGAGQSACGRRTQPLSPVQPQAPAAGPGRPAAHPHAVHRDRPDRGHRARLCGSVRRTNDGLGGSDFRVRRKTTAMARPVGRLACAACGEPGCQWSATHGGRCSRS